MKLRRGFFWLLTLLFLTGVGLAQAQQKRIPVVATLEFGVTAQSGSPAILGRAATDAVVLEMNRTGRFDSVPRSQVQQQIKESDLAPPFRSNEIQRLGQSLGADYVASGEITEIAFIPKPRRARVTLSLRLTDPATGELGNGAVETGLSATDTGAVEDETLIQQAITDAAFSTVRTMNRYAPVEATVLLIRSGREATLNRGSRDGIRPKQEMVVLRRGSYVGRVRVSSVGDTDCRADILDGGIRPEDRARAVFKMPDAPRRR
ncbi:MAG: hypothetical protein H7Z41_03650 [Cytophagales bacterium]|nr:hypothetical protein [Armatimonadota bacterium]